MLGPRRGRSRGKQIGGRNATSGSRRSCRIFAIWRVLSTVPSASAAAGRATAGDRIRPNPVDSCEGAKYETTQPYGGSGARSQRLDSERDTSTDYASCQVATRRQGVAPADLAASGAHIDQMRQRCHETRTRTRPNLSRPRGERQFRDIVGRHCGGHGSHETPEVDRRARARAGRADRSAPRRKGDRRRQRSKAGRIHGYARAKAPTVPRLNTIRSPRSRC